METHTERRGFARAPYEASLNFIILVTHGPDLHKIQATGTIINASETGIGIMTEFPLEPGYVLEWDDKHQRGKLHIALVKWSQQQSNLYRAGLVFI